MSQKYQKPGIALLPLESGEGRQRRWLSDEPVATSWTMDKETQHTPDRIDWDIRAADALERARMLPPGPERNEALKRASLLRCTADARGLTFAKRGRPPK